MACAKAAPWRLPRLWKEPGGPNTCLLCSRRTIFTSSTTSRLPSATPKFRPNWRNFPTAPATNPLRPNHRAVAARPTIYWQVRSKLKFFEAELRPSEERENQVRMLANPGNRNVELLMQLLQVHAWLVAKLHVFQLAPQPFHRIEFRSIARQKLNDQPRFANLLDEVRDGSSAVNRRPIPDDQQLARNHTEQAPQKRNAVQARKRFFADQRAQRSCHRHRSHHRKMVVRLPFPDHRRIAAWTVRSHHTWQWVEAGFVGKNQGAALLTRTPPQFGPHLLSPTGNLFLVPLNGTEDRNLWRPAQFLEQSGNMVPVVANTKFSMNHLGDANAVPQIARKSIRFRAVPQKVGDQLHLRGCQLRTPTMRLRQQRLGAAFLNFREPLADGAFCNPQSLGDIPMFPAAPSQTQSLKTTPFSPIVEMSSRHPPILLRGPNF